MQGKMRKREKEAMSTSTIKCGRCKWNKNRKSGKKKRNAPTTSTYKENESEKDQKQTE